MRRITVETAEMRGDEPEPSDVLEEDCDLTGTAQAPRVLPADVRPAMALHDKPEVRDLREDRPEFVVCQREVLIVAVELDALQSRRGNPVKLTGELVWRPRTTATLGREQQFGDQGFTKVTFGKNVRTVTPFMFVRSTSIKELYFEGDVPEFQKNSGGYDAFYGWGSKQATVYVPRGNASWLKWLEENTLPSCWKEVQFYNPDVGLKLVIQ